MGSEDTGQRQDGQPHVEDAHTGYTAAPTEYDRSTYDHPLITATGEQIEHPEQHDDDRDSGEYSPIAEKHIGDKSPSRNLSRVSTKSALSEDDIVRVLSHRLSRTSLSKATTQGTEHLEEQEEINRLLSRMFGRTRQEHSEEEKTRHVGVVFKNLTVRGMGLGAALQPTTADIFLGLPRALKKLFSRGPKGAASGPPVRTIIDDFSGCIKPGEMLLVLGRPGAGCSTFLKVIANQRFGFQGIEGDVTYGGTDAKTMAKNYRGEVLYNPEDDLHAPTLSVESTLKFAVKTRTPAKESRNEGETKADYVREFLRIATKLFWIEHTLKTKVGNEYIRGVSGGERKRVSIAEAMITKASTQCWDNSTKGLDASTALEYVQALRSLTNMAHVSTSVALYQAGESLYKLFDKVLLIDGGQCCYFGPADEAAAYFKNLGFVQPDRWTTADFLTSVTDEHERRIKDGFEHRIPRSSRQFGEAFLKSDRHAQNLAEIEDFETELQRVDTERRAVLAKAKRRNYTIPFREQVWACTKRQYLIMLGDRQTLVGKWGGITFQALIVGSLFFDLPKDTRGVFPRGGVLFFMLLFNALLALAELTAAFTSRPIMLKHKSFSFYRPAAFAIAQTVTDIPLVFVQVFIFDIIIYWMANLQRTASQFFISLLFLWMLTMTMYALFRSIGALSASLDAATRVTGVIIQALIVYTGYLIPPKKMHPWLSWLRWINPVQYGFEALMVNEFYNLEIECVAPNLVPLVPNASTRYQGCALQGSVPGEINVSGANYLDVAYGYKRSHLWRNFGIIIAFFIFFVSLTALGMEIQKPNKGGGSVTIFKRGQAPKAVEQAIERVKSGSDDEEVGKEKSNDLSLNQHESTSDSEGSLAKGIAKNETIFTWQNVNYTIPVSGGERQLLRDVQGFVKPGKLTALMGASGAGKTTLLNTLAQRIRFGVVTGDFLVDGRPLPKAFQRSTGFAEQMDIHEPTSTVREALRFSAKLRRPKEVPLQEKYDYCEKIIDLLEMRDIAGATVGVGGAGLNQEQRKRLTIGVELASKPDLLMFLDEPTSGLDSGAAFNIVRFLRRLADAGQAILCTIHQPSSVLFTHFDTLLLLKSGGRTVYFGDLGTDSRTLLDYLEKNGAKKCPSRANPAEYMLEAIGAGNPDYKGPDWGDIWDASSEKQAVTKEVQSLISSRRSAASVGAVNDDRDYAMPLSAQLTAVLHRSFVSFWRNPPYVIGLFMLHIFTGLFNSFTFWHLGNSRIDMQSRLFSVFMTLTISPPLIQQLQPRFLKARDIFSSRESNSKIYSWFAFTTGAVISEIPYRIVAGTLYWCCWYWPTWFPRDTYTSVSVWAFIMVFELFYLGFGQAIAAFAPSELLASILVPVFFLFVVSFCGVVVPYNALPTFWRSWMYWLTPFHYWLEGVLGLIVHKVPVRCSRSEMAIYSAPPGQSCQSYSDSYVRRAGGYVTTLDNGQCGFCQFSDGDQYGRSLNIYSSHIWRDYGIFWAFVLFNLAVVFFGSWLYLQGGRQMAGRFGRKGRAARKARATSEKSNAGDAA